MHQAILGLSQACPLSPGCFYCKGCDKFPQMFCVTTHLQASARVCSFCPTALLLPRSLPFLKQALLNRADSFALGSPHVPPCPLSLLNGMDNSDYCGNAWIIKVRTPSNRTVASERVDLNGSPAKKALERETGCPHTTCSLSLAVHSMCRELQGEVQGTPRESLCPHQKPERSL